MSMKAKLNTEYIQEYLCIKLRKFYIKKTAQKRKKLINIDEFTVISNNCWGANIYQSYGISYKSPTIGMYIMPNDYIKFIGNLRYYMGLKLDFVKPKESKHYNELSYQSNFGSYPVGKLDDIELMLLHYTSEEEAYEKWTKRCKRINWDKIILKFNDQYNCKDKHIRMFDELDHKNKIFFSSKKHADIKSQIYIEQAKEQHSIRTCQEPFGKSKATNINDLINSL